jgi:hypothetical protein
MVEPQNTTEEWRRVPVCGIEDFYSVSNRGRVRRELPCKGTSPGKIILGSKDSRGYPQVNLHAGPIRKRILVHHLVCLAFIEEPRDGRETNHKDGCKTNNSLENLEWVTRKENIRHAREIGLIKPGADKLVAWLKSHPELRARGARVNTAKLTDRKVREIRALFSSGVKAVPLSKIYGVSNAMIGYIVRRKNWTHVI